MEPRYIFEIEGLSYSYPQGQLAIDNVTVGIEKGRKIAILGPNGAGKSTLFLHLNGVLKPSKGKIRFDGKPLSYKSKELSKLREKVAVVLQNPDDQIFSSTVEEDVAFGPLNLGLPPQEVDQRVEAALFQTGLTEMKGNSSQRLSFGQRKRVALAGALAMRPQILIMDEPTAGLDPQMVEDLLELAETLNNDGITIIVSTHDVDLAYAWADDIIVLSGGHLMYAGPPEDFFSDRHRVHEAGLTVPAVFEMNAHLAYTLGKDPLPYPRSFIELFAKSLSMGNMNVGILHLDVLDDRAPELRPNGTTTCGVYGSLSRRTAYSAGRRIDYCYNGMENCLKDILSGKDTTLHIDLEKRSSLDTRLNRLEQLFGVRVPVHDMS